MEQALTLVIAAAAAMAAEPEPVQLPGVDWKQRADARFKSKEEKDRKDQMKEASRAIKRPCKYCHTEDFTDFVGHQLITQQMMAVAAENGVQCKDCHAGKEKLTELGEKAVKMWDMAREKKVFCDDCHEKGESKFEKLTPNGKKFHDELEARKKGPVAAPASATPSAAPARP